MNAEGRNRLRVGAAVLIASALFTQAAFAQSPERDLRFESVSRTIDITGLDLSSRPGAERLYRQIARSAREICQTDIGKGVSRVKHDDQARRCFDEAVDSALAQVVEKTGVDLEQVAGATRYDYADLVAWR